MKFSTKNKIKESLSIVIVLTLIFLIVNLGYEIIVVEQFRGIGFSKGYITVSGNRIGHHILAYILAMIIGFAALFFTSADEV